MDKMQYGSDYKFLPVTSLSAGLGQEIVPDIFSYTIQVVNVCFIGYEGENDNWVLIDAGMPNSADKIISAAEERFGENCRPKAIVLTHGHFDHVGSIIELVEHWNIPVYAHKNELPYLTGKLSYPEPDASVEGGLVAKMSPMFPNEPINLGEYIEVLPEDGSIPMLEGWKWIHTPGHSPGHISLFREEDRALVAGDAFVTVRQDSLYKVLVQQQEVNGPPRYLTTEWGQAKRSVETLRDLQPYVAVTGHGTPMWGHELTEGLEKLVQNFDEIAMPDYGRYVNKRTQ